MSVAYRGSQHDSSTTATVTSLSPPITGWTDGDPAVGDAVFIAGFVMALGGGTWTQSAGTGTWTIHSTDANSASAMTSFAASRIFDGTETVPTFTWSGSAARAEWNLAAFTPDPGSAIAVDAWGVTVITSGTSFTASAATCAGNGEASLIMHCFMATAVGTTPTSFVGEQAWATTSGGSATYPGDASTNFSGSCNLRLRLGLTGTVTPGPCTVAVNAAGTLYHVLIGQSAVTPQTAVPPVLVGQSAGTMSVYRSPQPMGGDVFWTQPLTGAIG